MWPFSKSRKTRSEEMKSQFDAASDRYMRDRDFLAADQAGAYAIYFSHMSGALREAGPAGFAAMRPDELDKALAIHATWFEDDAAFAKLVSGYPAQVRGALEKLRVESAPVRRALQPPPVEAAPPATARAPQIDLESLLGPKDPITRRARLLDWLRAQPPEPDLWHVVATQSDPDGMDAIFLWIVQQLDCDAATAAHIFHAVNAFEVLDHQHEIDAPAWRERAAIARTVAGRWARNDFVRYELAFEERGYEETLASYRALEGKAAARFGASSFVAPEGLFAFKAGREPQTRYFYSDFEPYAAA
ncbi:MAG: DUF4274 domain-containing protein [Methylobacteriaceae bacterium]|nr:DUF4274 domain-containing protein [Methylobacteriaceae bacterium]